MHKPPQSRIPHALVILFAIMVLVTLVSYVLPTGSYERILVSGKLQVVPGSYTPAPPNPLDILDLFKAIPMGFQSACSGHLSGAGGGYYVWHHGRKPHDGKPHRKHDQAARTP